MATTTTVTAVVDQMTTVLRALTPSTAPTKKFDRAPRDQLIRDWAGTRAGSVQCLRKFEIVETGAVFDPSHADPAAVFRIRTLTLTVAYPKKLHALYGRDRLEDLETMIEQDATQIRDALYSSGNLIDGQLATLVTQLPTDRGNGDAWFKDFELSVRLHESQTLT